MSEDKKEESSVKLADVFAKIINFVENIDDTVKNDTFQKNVVENISSCEKAIILLNELGIFSTNEDIEEVTSHELKYFIFPAFLGILYENQIGGDRLNVLNKAKEHFADFIKLCRNYGLTQAKINVQFDSDKKETAENNERAVSKIQKEDLNALFNQREEKIKKYKEKKALEEKLNSMKNVINEASDDETVRDYYLTLIRIWINRSLEEVSAIEREIPLLSQMTKVKESGQNNVPGKKFETKTAVSQRPFIILRNEVQKQVYGLGYPSMPMFTVDEFYEQRVRDGVFPDPAAASHAHGGGESHTYKVELSYEEEQKQEELKEEEELMKQRRFDDFKDDHRRGWGNTDNKG